MTGQRCLSDMAAEDGRSDVARTINVSERKKTVQGNDGKVDGSGMLVAKLGNRSKQMHGSVVVA